MVIEKCDLCGKEVPRGSCITVGYHVPFPQYALCDDCGAPIVVFMKKHELAAVK